MAQVEHDDAAQQSGGADRDQPGASANIRTSAAAVPGGSPEALGAIADAFMKLDQESLSRSPAVYALGDPDLMELFEAYLGREGLRCRTFTDARVTLEEFVSAQPRPAVLVTGCLDYDGSGLALIRKCQEIEPGLKVVLWSGHDEKTMASLLAMIPVTVDARFPKGEACDMRKLVETIEALARDTGVAPLTAL